MTLEETIKWLQAIKEKYIRNGDDTYDAKRKKAIDNAVESIETWIKVIEAEDITKVVEIVRDYVTGVRV